MRLPEISSLMSDTKLSEVARVFLKLGFTAFGGPAAHIALMHKEVVKDRQWITEEHFLDLVGATNLIPGPNSTEMAIHLGYERAGWKGLIVAGLCFILPAVIITGLFAIAYKEYGQLPELQPFLYGIKPAIIAVILAAIFPLAVKALRNSELAAIGIMALVLCLCGFNEILILFGSGLIYLVFVILKGSIFKKNINSLFPIGLLQIIGTNTNPVSGMNLFLIFLKIGAILYGSGYVLFALLDAELVSTGLLKRQQLIDAIAMGQFTPGPVFSAVTFIGYQINDAKGALLSTIGIFLPSFVFVALLNPIVKLVRGSAMFSSFLDAVNIASVAVIVVVCYEMGKETITDAKTIMIGIISLVIVFGFKQINTAWIILGGAILGFLLHKFV